MTAGAPASINRTARLAGALYLSVVPFAAFTFLYARPLLVDPADAAATARNIMASEWLFRSATASHLVTQIIFVFQVLALYRLLSLVSRDGAMHMVALALVSIPVSLASEVGNLAALQLLGSADEGAFTAAQLHAQAMRYLEMSQSGILIAQVFWGLWLLPLGWLVFRSRFLPAWLGVLVLIAGAAYTFDSLAQLLSPGFPTVSQYTVVCELLLPLWLVVKGVNVERWLEMASG